MTVRFFIIAALAIALTSTSYSQGKVSATATATIVTPIAISNEVDMNFGNIAVQAETGGTLVLSPAGQRTTSGGVTLTAAAGTVTAASFGIAGIANYSYIITLPTSVTLNNGVFSLNATTFTSNLLTGAGLLDETGTQIVNIGATLNVGAAQAAGLYVSTTSFDVTVNYN